MLPPKVDEDVWPEARARMPKPAKLGFISRAGPCRQYPAGAGAAVFLPAGPGRLSAGQK